MAYLFRVPRIASRSELSSPPDRDRESPSPRLSLLAKVLSARSQPPVLHSLEFFRYSREAMIVFRFAAVCSTEKVLMRLVLSSLP